MKIQANSPIKRHRLAEWIKKHGPTYAVCKTHLIGKNTHRLKLTGWKKIFYANIAWKQEGIAVFISDEADLKQKLNRREQEGHFILIKEQSNKIQQ